MNNRLDEIALFVQVVDSGNFSNAATYLNLSRSAVGKSIAKLEQRLGVMLFQRTTRQQYLTEEGQLFYERCLKILSDLKEAEAALEDGRREPSGKLKVSVPVLFGRLYIAPILMRLMQHYPKLNIEISFNDRNVDLVQEGFDLAVRISSLPDTTNLVAKRLATQRMSICGSPNYFAQHGKPSKIDDLVQHQGILYSLPGLDKSWLARDAHGQIQTVSITPRLYMNDLEAIADAAIAGIGLAWLPCWLIAKKVQQGKLLYALDKGHLLESHIHVIWPKAGFIPSKTRIAIDQLTQELASW